MYARVERKVFLAHFLLFKSSIIRGLNNIRIFLEFDFHDDKVNSAQIHARLKFEIREVK